MHTLKITQLIICGLCALMLPACSRSRQTTARTDTGPIESRWPGLAPVEKTWWEGEITSQDSVPFVPGPSMYRMRGYVWLSAGKSDALLKKHAWSPAPAGWQPACPLPEATAGEQPQWRVSPGCTEALCKPPRLMGDFYFCPESRLIYFEIAGD